LVVKAAEKNRTGPGDCRVFFNLCDELSRDRQIS